MLLLYVQQAGLQWVSHHTERQDLFCFILIKPCCIGGAKAQETTSKSRFPKRGSSLDVDNRGEVFA